MCAKVAVDRVKECFLENFSKEVPVPEVGAAVSVWADGEEMCHFFGGKVAKEGAAWGEETLVPVYSATKGPAAATLLMCLEAVGMDGESEVERVWPEFPSKGATFAELLSHQCGLAALDEAVSVKDYEAVIGAIERQVPAWGPSTTEEGHGYHPRTVGFLVDECVRRLTGQTLGEVWRERVAEPLGLDFFIGGLTEVDQARVATLYPGKVKVGDDEGPFYSEFNREGSLVRGAFTSPRGIQGVQEMNKAENRNLALPAMGGVGTAQALAKFYQAVLGKVEGSPFSEDVLRQFSTRRLNGFDQVLRTETSFSMGMMMDPLDKAGVKRRQLFGSSMTAFGHAGAGGSHAFADPERGISVAYVMNQMELCVLPGARARGLVDAL